MNNTSKVLEAISSLKSKIEDNVTKNSNGVDLLSIVKKISDRGREKMKKSS